MNKKLQEGQSLVELLIGLGIISIMVGASTVALVSVLRSSTVAEQNQSAGLIGNSLLESASVLTEGNWNSIYNLSKTSANHYFLINSPTTTSLAIIGDESVLEQNIINGLVGHWKFDEISTNTTWAYDSSGTGNLGALTNSPTRTASASCKVGACLSFDGTDDSIDVGNTIDANINGTNSKTIMAWIKPTSIAVGDHIVTKWTTSATGAGWQFNFGVGTKLEFWARNSAATDWNYIANTASFTTGSWQHAAVTIDAGVIKLYQNGVEIAGTYTGSALDATNALSVQIGTRRGSAAEFFDGSIDDVRIYNRALSATEITQLYNSPAYSRYFYVDNVKRTLCGTGVITTDAESTCLGASGVSQDPSTQKITASISWNLKGVSGSLENSIYMTRWVNSVSKQTDWGGASETAGAVSEFGTNYFDYSGISTTTSGAIKVSGI